MGKNRIKKLRDITVDGKLYKWMVESVIDGKKLKIWEDKNTVFYEGILYGEEFTPSDVKEVIDDINWDK
jgi:hypothetical protein